jgi:hypothetical protein
VNGRVDNVEKQIALLRNEMNVRFDSLECKVMLVEGAGRLRIEMKTLTGKVAVMSRR